MATDYYNHLLLELEGHVRRIDRLIDFIADTLGISTEETWKKFLRWEGHLTPEDTDDPAAPSQEA